MMWRRYVAIGDSTTEGLDDPDEAGGYRGWADRFALAVARAQGGLEYANLAIRGRTTARIRAEQLPVALELAPDLATVVAGMNDVLRPSFDADRLREDLRAIHAGLTGAGARTVTFTMPDMGSVAPIAATLRPRFRQLNAITRDLADEFGTVVVDLDREPIASHPALWDDDRLHGNSEGHRRIALALAEGLGLEVDDDWRSPLPAVPRRLPQVLLGEARWVVTHLLPWAVRHARGHSSGDVITAKRPELMPL